MARPSRSLRRSRLSTDVVDVLSARITLVTAPRGFGKSSLLDQWCDELSRLAELIRLDLRVEHNSPPSFRGALATASRDAMPSLDWAPADAPSAADMGSYLQASQPQSRRRPTVPLVIMLDAVDVISDAGVVDVIAAALELLPDDVHFVIASSTPVTFPMSRWRSRDAVLELDAHDLAFDQAEVAAFCAARGVEHCTPGDVLDRTSGWPTGVVLMLRRSRPAQLTVRDFAADELLPALTTDLRWFLLDTAVLESVTVAAADAVRLDDRSAAHLDELDRRGAFPLRDRLDATVWRHPPIVREALPEILAREDRARAEELGARALLVHAQQATLSPRECDVVAQLDSDMSIAEIAQELTISFHTARTHVRSIYAKLGTTSRAGAVRRARDLGLLGP